MTPVVPVVNIEAMLSRHHKDYRTALGSKRQLATLDRLLSDNHLDRHLKRWGGMDIAGPPQNKLTLGTALLVRPEIAAAVDEQLRTLGKCIYGDRVQSVVKQLLNGTEGLLNTWSELGLAMRLVADGWTVEIGHVFFGEKDVDVRAGKDGDVRFVDVINFAPEPIENTMDGFQPMPGSTPLDPKLRDKVLEKMGSKFAKARAAGWTGSAWVAVDYSKNHGLSIDLLFRQPFSGEPWKQELAADLGAIATGLDGVVYYEFGAVDYVRAMPLTWTAVAGRETAG